VINRELHFHTMDFVSGHKQIN